MRQKFSNILLFAVKYIISAIVQYRKYKTGKYKNLKIKFYISLLLLAPVFLYAQPPADWGAFFQNLDAQKFAGKKFRLEAAVKVQLLDPTAEAEIWARVDRPKKQMGFFYNMMDKPIRTANWTVFTINGKVDKDATNLACTAGSFADR